MNVPKAKRPKKRVRPVSARRALETPVYLAKRKAFLEAHPWCAVWMSRHVSAAVTEDGTIAAVSIGSPLVRSEEVHHKFCGAQRKKHFLDESTWLAVSAEGHRYIHAHPAEARARGWLL